MAHLCLPRFALLETIICLPRFALLETITCLPRFALLETTVGSKLWKRYSPKP
jgi:hypothetical protein